MKANARLCIMVLFLGFLQRQICQGQSRSEFKVTDKGLWPSVALDNSGNAHIIWSNEGIVYRLYDSTGYSGRDSLKIFTGTLPPHSKISFLNDRLLIVWNNRTIAFNSYIDGQLVSKSGELLGSSVELNDTYGDAERGGTQVSLLTDTSFIVVWAGNGPQTPSSAVGIYGQRVSHSLSVINKNLFISSEDSTRQTAAYPGVSSNRLANSFVVVWLDNPSRPNNLVGKLYFKDGTSRSGKFIVAGGEGTSYIWSPRVVMKSDGGFWVAWSSTSQDSVWNIFLRGYKENGNPEGTIKKINVTPANYASEVRLGIDSDDSFVLAWESLKEGKSKILIQKFKPSGVLVGENIVVSQSDSGNQIFPELSVWNKRVCVVWQSDAGIMAKFIDTDDTTVGILRNENTSRQFSLYANYPNPFNFSTTIVYSLQNETEIKVSVFDIAGKEIQTLEEGKRTSGQHSIMFIGTNYSSGVYLVRLVSRDFILSRRIVLLK